RARLMELETQQEAAREQRVRWQVEAAQVEARLAAARERAARAGGDADAARHQGTTLAEEIATIDRDTAALTAQQAEWADALKQRRQAVEIGRAPSELQSRGHLVCRLLLEK